MSSFFRRDRAVIIVNSLLMNAGVERRTLDFARFLQRRGLHVEVCVLRELGKIAPLFEQAGIPVRLVKVYEYDDAAGATSYFPLRFLGLVWHLKWGRFGLVFCVQPPSSIFGRLACYPPWGRGIVAMERYLVSGRSKRRLRIDRWMARWSHIVCVSTLLRDDLMADAGIPASAISVIEDGVSIEPPVSAQEELRARLAGRFVFGCVGLLTRRKRQSLLIEALAGLPRDTPAGRPAVVLVGGGEDEELLKNLTAQLGLEEDVIFAGEQSHVHDFYPLFDAFVFPSVGEGLGNVWAEAMLHGLPVICADTRPMSDYIEHNKNGLLAKPDDAASLRAEMLRLMESEGLRRDLGEAGKAFAREHFDGERQMEKLLAAAENRLTA
jgi:glycosyltransferase involved in cell wall biosynthesis